MFPPDLSQLTVESLQRLIDNQVTESKSLDYKRDLPGNESSRKRELLADISAFANAFGGHMVIGMDSRDGVPVELRGVSGVTEDEVKQRIENVCADGIEPRLLGVSIRAVRLGSGAIVFVLHIPRSWIGPHRVTLVGHGHFYVRDSKGKHPMDTEELRAAFTATAGLVNRIRAFRDERHDLVLRQNAGPVTLPGPGLGSPLVKVLVHLVPLTAFASTELINIDSQQQLLRSIQPVAPRRAGYKSAVNLDGHVNSLEGYDLGGFWGYVQFFRTGIVEHAACFDVDETNAHRTLDGRKLEEHILDCVKLCVNAQRQLNMTPPICVLLTLGSTAGTSLIPSGSAMDQARAGPRSDRDQIQLPENVLEHFEVDISKMLVPTFEIMWNAFGRHRPAQ